MRKYIGTDKNGTKIYHDDTCHRCGGQGALDQWRFTGCTCYECGGSGRSKVRVEKVYTPEYRAILDARAKVRADKKAEEYRQEQLANAERINAEFMEKHFFSSETIAVIKGDTYEIKDTLKAEGCKFRNGIGWYTKETSRGAHIVAVKDLVQTTEYGIFQMKDVADLSIIIKDLNKKDALISEYQGSEGDRVELELTVVASIGFTVPSFRGYGTETMYINKMVDANGNIYVWKTGSSLDGVVKLKGTIKGHEEYQDEKQTVLTRCRVQ